METDELAASPDALAEVCGSDILGRIASLLPPNEIACTLRLVSRSTAEQFRGQAVVRLSQPSPAAAFAAHWSAPGACRALSYQRRLQLSCLTAASGDVCNLEVALAAAGLCPNTEVMAAAAAAGQLHVCRWLAERGCPLEGPILAPSPLLAAAKGGHAEICEWLLERGCAWSEECVRSAGLGDHPELMRALLRKAPPGPSGIVRVENLLIAAAEGCDLGAFQELWREWALDEPAGVDWERVRSSAVTAAARSPTPDWAAKVAWLLEQGAVQSRESVVSAAASCPDAPARMTLLVEGMGLPIDASALESAAWEGRADAVRWLLARGLPAFTHGAFAAAGRGHTEVLRALHAAGCELLPPAELISLSCHTGSLEAVSWVVEACGPEALPAAGPRAFDAALTSGSLELVTWLHERGLGPGPCLWRYATLGGCVAVLEVLAEWGADVQDPSWQAGLCYRAAAKAGDPLTLEALRRLGVPLGRTPQEREDLVARVIRDTQAPPLPALRWLRQAVGEVDWAAAVAAARSSPERAGWRGEVRAWVEAEAEAEAAAKAQAGG